MESHKRSLAKAASWRLMALVFTTGVVWLATGRPALAVSVGVAEVVVKMLAFYVHERVWNRVDFGRSKHVDYQI